MSEGGLGLPGCPSSKVFGRGWGACALTARLRAGSGSACAQRTRACAPTTPPRSALVPCPCEAHGAPLTPPSSPSTQVGSSRIRASRPGESFRAASYSSVPPAHLSRRPPPPRHPCRTTLLTRQPPYSLTAGVRAVTRSTMQMGVTHSTASAPTIPTWAQIHKTKQGRSRLSSMLVATGTCACVVSCNRVQAHPHAAPNKRSETTNLTCPWTPATPPF